jgi:hypothetical protein
MNPSEGVQFLLMVEVWVLVLNHWLWGMVGTVVVTQQERMRRPVRWGAGSWVLGAVILNAVVLVLVWQ